MPEFRSQRLIAALAAILVIACSGAPDAPPTAALDAGGTWNALGEVPGSAEQWTLAVSGSSVSGTGTWSGEACCGGTITITGTARADSLHLDLKYFKLVPVPDTSVAFANHIDAVLTTPEDLVGTVRRSDGFSGQVHFTKRPCTRPGCG